MTHFDLRDYAVVGYSLGGRTAVRMLARGARPIGCVAGGMGDRGVIDPKGRIAFLGDLVRQGVDSSHEAGRFVAGLIARRGLKAGPLLHVLESQPATSPESLSEIETPVLVLNGVDDHDNGSAAGLASLMTNARAQLVPGDHVSALRTPELKVAILAFLRETYRAL
jgi:pimeloyl-ACP methyl ester carboxylesterase